VTCLNVAGNTMALRTQGQQTVLILDIPHLTHTRTQSVHRGFFT